MSGFKEGPLSILYNCMTKGLKLKVWTKRHTGFRGVCIGYLIAFDKHMNLVGTSPLLLIFCIVLWPFVRLQISSKAYSLGRGAQSFKT